METVFTEKQNICRVYSANFDAQHFQVTNLVTNFTKVYFSTSHQQL